MFSNDVGYFYVDGSFLFASIERVKRAHTELKDSKLNISELSGELSQLFNSNISQSIRVNFYFRKADPRIKTMLTIPSIHNAPGHWRIIECGTNLKGQKILPSEVIDTLPAEYRDTFPRAEKGVDMELACDALLLAAGGKVNSFVFVINDRDYIPLLQSIQRLGANTYIAGLDIRQKVQDDLLKFADRYLTLESNLNRIFDYEPPITDSPEAGTQEAAASTQ
ncbi:NYN domain-containing protein [Candidatus Saccharibacteria bacterium]|nr:MAG: NYN domain-containing protein [Candidatus Saccharibacteria bacterium]